MRAFLHSIKILAIGLGLFAVAHGARTACAEPTGFVDKVFLEGTVEHRYVVYVPPDYDPTRRWPVVLYLHGAGFSGTDGRLQVAAGLARVIRAQGDFPAIVVFPQCEAADAPLLTRWLADSPDGQRALRILDDVEHHYSIDPTRRALVGWSMGGYGAWSLAAAAPQRWSAVVAVSGGGDPQTAPQITAPVWAIHGAADRAIPPERSQQMVDAVNASGGRAVLTILDGVAHDAWRPAFLAQAVREWMLSTATGSPDSAALVEQTEDILCTGQAEDLDGEFRPALIIPRAISLRVGAEALRTLAYGVPNAADRGLLTGKLDDQTFDFSAVGESFRVRLDGLAYDAALKRILVEPQASGAVRLRVGLQPLTITIGGTHVRSATRTADAGAATIRIGHRYPVWMDLLVQPLVAEGRLRLGLNRADFHIPDANWVVVPPDDVTVSGPDLTPELAQTALVGGLYLRREQIEQYVRDALPGMVSRLEERLQPARIDRIVASVWPLPVFRPRLQIWPEEIAVDSDGLSFVMSVAAAPFNAQPHPDQPTIAAPMGPHAAELGKCSGLEVGMSPGVLQSLSGMIVEAHAAHIDVRDMPEPVFQQFADRAVLTRILPALASQGEGIEVRTEFNLAAPLAVERSNIPDAVQFTSADAGQSRPSAALATPAPSHTEIASVAARFEIPQLEVTVLTRQPATSRRWQDFAHFNVRLTHLATLQLARTGHYHRIARLTWNGEPEIEVVGGYVDGALAASESVDRAQLGRLVQESWGVLAGNGTTVEKEIPDLVLGTARLRIDAVHWGEQALLATFQTPQTRITNSGPRLIEYAVRGPFSGWSERRQLKPGATDVYSSPAELIVRRFPQPVDTAIKVPVGGELDLAGATH